MARKVLYGHKQDSKGVGFGGCRWIPAEVTQEHGDGSLDLLVQFPPDSGHAPAPREKVPPGEDAGCWK